MDTIVPGFGTRTVYTTGITTKTMLTTILSPSAEVIGTYVVGEPQNFATTTIYYAGSESLTAERTVSTVTPPGSVAGTYIVETPQAGYVTVFTSGVSAFQSTTVSTVPPSGSASGTYFVATGARETVTSTTAYVPPGTVSGRFTSTTISGTGAQANTVVVATPLPPVACAAHGYVVWGQSFSSVDLLTGSALDVGSLEITPGDRFSTLGFNSIGGYPYGTTQPSNILYHIGGNGRAMQMSSPLIAGELYAMGDVNGLGHLWIGYEDSTHIHDRHDPIHRYASARNSTLSARFSPRAST